MPRQLRGTLVVGDVDALLGCVAVRCVAKAELAFDVAAHCVEATVGLQEKAASVACGDLREVRRTSPDLRPATGVSAATATQRHDRPIGSRSRQRTRQRRAGMKLY